jgi:hypothetical protein
MPSEKGLLACIFLLVLRGAFAETLLPPAGGKNAARLSPITSRNLLY